MVFNEGFIRLQANRLFKEAKLVHADDFEFSLELPAYEHQENNFIKPTLESIMQICSLSFWSENRFQIQPLKSFNSKPGFNTYMPLRADAVIISSSAIEIIVEIFIYQAKNKPLSFILKSNFELNTTND